MRILAICNKNSSCDYHRVSMPLKNMNIQRDDLITIIYGDQKLTRSDLKNNQIIIFNRLPPKNIDVLINFSKIYGYKMVMDLDDYWKLYPHHYMYNEWVKQDIEKKTIYAMGKVDMVIVTNQKLADKVKDFNKNVEVVPNSLPIGKDQFIVKKNKSDKIRILLNGGASHYFDIKCIEPLLLKAKNDIFFRENVEFVLSGYNPDSELSIKIKNIVMKSGRVSTIKNLPLSQYMAVYNYADIVLAPLENNNFNTFKSNLKIIESGCKKVPIVCSSIHPYTLDKLMDGKGLFLCENSKDWYEKVKYLAMNEDKREQFAEELYNYVEENYNIKGWNEKRYKIIKNLI